MRRNRKTITVQLVAAIYDRGKLGKSFSTTALADELKINVLADREWVSNKMYQWKKAGFFRELPRTGMAQLFELQPSALGEFAPPPTAQAAPVPTEPESVTRMYMPVEGSLDAVLRTWLAGQLQPFGTMLKAAVGEVQRLRVDVDALLELASRPEGERPAIPEPQPQPEASVLKAAAAQFIGHNGSNWTEPVTLTPALPVSETALAQVVDRLGWMASTMACKDFETLDGYTQARVVRVLRAAAQMPDSWPKLGRQFGTAGQIPQAYRRPGTWWSFRAGKKDRVMVRRNGKNTVVEALVKRNDHRWYNSEK